MQSHTVRELIKQKRKLRQITIQQSSKDPKGCASKRKELGIQHFLSELSPTEASDNSVFPQDNLKTAKPTL